MADDTIKDEPVDRVKGREGAENLLQFTPPPPAIPWDQLDKFVGVVFDVELAEGEHVYAQISSKAPRGYGRAWGEFDATVRKVTDRSSRPQKAYFCTATLRLTETDEGPQLRHTRDAFVAYWLVVLDDVGTKVPWERLPETLTPTYRIETSPGNFQLGLVLKEPIDSYDEAQALIDLFVNAGLTDSGGAMPVKKVRLPAGVHGKHDRDEEDPKHFEVRLAGLDAEQIHDPQTWLDMAGIDADWESERRVDPVSRRRALALSPVLLPQQEGHVDELLEWQAEAGRVVGEGEHFYDVICPFEHLHSDHHGEARLCGYSPLGHGQLPHSRVFHCFHGHHTREGHTHQDYIDELVKLGAPLVPVTETLTTYHRDYVMDMGGNVVWRLPSEGPPVPESVTAVRDTAPPLRVGNREYNPFKVWQRSAARVKVKGAIYNPTRPAQLTEDEHGEAVVNLYWQPSWDHPGAIDEALFKPFLDHLDFLIPNDTERKYFLDWLACKVQDPTFRGNAIVMVTPAEGVGRSLLADVLRKLWSGNNVEELPQAKVTGKSDGFNDWQENQYVVVNETASAERIHDQRAAYNALKDHIDPRGAWVTINPKYGKKRRSYAGYSVLMNSNNPDAIWVPQGTEPRRFYVIQNPRERHPDGADYYGPLFRWIAAGGWEAHLWAWLAEREVDFDAMTAAAPMTAGAVEMQDEAKNFPDRVVDAVFATWGSPIYPPATAFKNVFVAAAVAAGENHVEPVPCCEKAIKRALRRRAHSAEDDGTRLEPVRVPETKSKVQILRVPEAIRPLFGVIQAEKGVIADRFGDDGKVKTSCGWYQKFVRAVLDGG